MLGPGHGIHERAGPTSGVDGDMGSAGMADLIAIGYPDETTTLAATDGVGRLELQDQVRDLLSPGTSALFLSSRR
jgi:hypothetical protein